MELLDLQGIKFLSFNVAGPEQDIALEYVVFIGLKRESKKGVHILKKLQTYLLGINM